jgi:hypothetical protein
MTDPANLEIIYRDLENEHRRLMKLIDRLGVQDTMNGLLPLLDELRILLIVHFAREQLPDGFYEALGKRAYDRRDEIQALIADHGAILSSMNALLEDATTAAPAMEADVLSRVAKLADQLRDHEFREHRFAENVMGKGEGTGD